MNENTGLQPIETAPREPVLAKALQLRGDDIAHYVISGSLGSAETLAGYVTALQRAYAQELQIAELARKYVEADDALWLVLDYDDYGDAMKNFIQAVKALRAAVKEANCD